METNKENEAQTPKEVGSNLTGAAMPVKDNQSAGQENSGQQQEDKEYLRKAEDALPDANKHVENTDALIGDVNPTDRNEKSQEEKNANNEQQSDSSKISGENL